LLFASRAAPVWRRAVAAIALQLAKTHKLLAERSSENGIFVDFGARIHIDKRKLVLTGAIATQCRD
jgi:hypothetical protein